jgi:hypothetical protein
MALDGGGSESTQRDRARRCAVQTMQRLIAIDGLEQVSVALKDVMPVDVDLEQQWRLALTHGGVGSGGSRGAVFSALSRSSCRRVRSF